MNSAQIKKLTKQLKSLEKAGIENECDFPASDILPFVNLALAVLQMGQASWDESTHLALKEIFDSLKKA